MVFREHGNWPSVFALTNPGYHPVEINRVVVQPVADLDLAFGGGEAVDTIASQVMTDRSRCVNDSGNRACISNDLEALDVIVAGIEQHAVGHRRRTIHAHVAMHNGFATQVLNGSDDIDPSLEPFVFLPTAVVVRTQVVVVHLGCMASNEVLVAPFAAQIDDVGDAFVDPRLKLRLTDFGPGGVEVAANGEPIVDMAKAPVPGGRV